MTIRFWYAATTRVSSGMRPPDARRYSGRTYNSASSIGMTSSVPWITSDPCWFQRVIWGDISWSWLMRATICDGPNTSFCFGNWKTSNLP